LCRESLQKNEEGGFKYLLAKQKEFCVISFVGPINNKAKEELGKCLDEIKNTESCLFILNFRDVTGIDKAIHRQLVQIQHCIRSKESGGHLRICGINPKWKHDLTSVGTLRPDEMVDNVRVALAELNKLK